MIQRPASDRYLDASLALAAVREQLPALECRCAEPLGTGWGTDVYLLDDRFVARFPRTAEGASLTRFDQAVFDLVAKLAPGGPVDAIAWKPIRPGRYTGYWESYKSEIAAYELDKFFGLGHEPR